ncbi:hypothetical protein DdX_12261 [Ditylenchus destructor]|uniref:Uncharacterized protein n=1 Tax=Ditylenchus destructor TaxID=166010 RepID=A0AAD4MY06_9BILA|nr:hypothetical protein DdX_12261 [Ditylenchus destructor]
MILPIFGLFLVLVAPGASIVLSRGSDGGRGSGDPRGSSGARGSGGGRGSSYRRGLESADLEKEVDGFLKVLRKDNDEVLRLAEDLLKQTQAAKILDLTKELSKEFSIVQSVSNRHLEDRRLVPLSYTDDLVINVLEALNVGPEGLFYIPSLSAVEASSGLYSRPPRVVTNPLVDSNHTPVTYEDLIKRLGGLAKAYADALNKNVKLIPLAVIDDSFIPSLGRMVARKPYKDFAVALVEVVPSWEPLGVELKALAALAIRIHDRIIPIPY